MSRGPRTGGMHRLRALGWPLVVLVGSALGIYLEHGPLLRNGLSMAVGPIPAVWFFYLGVPMGLLWLSVEVRDPDPAPPE